MKIAYSGFLIAVGSFALTAFGTSIQGKHRPTRMLNQDPLTAQQVQKKCIPIEMGESTLDCVSCEVHDVQALGKLGGETFSVAHYEYSWAKDTGLGKCGFGSVLLRQIPGSGKLKPLWGGLSSVPPSKFAQAQVIESPAGQLIQIPIRSDGTGQYQDDGILSWKDGQLHEIDTQSYQNDLASHLPQGLTINKGIYPDFNEMSVETGLWKKEDPNCCPTGGKLKALLEIRDDKIVVKSVENEDGQPL